MEPLFSYKDFPEGLTPEQSSAFEAVYAKPVDFDAPNNLIALSRDEAEKYLVAPNVKKIDVCMISKYKPCVV